MISVIIPYYNHSLTLEKTLLSIAAQQAVVTEVILVDDGSTIGKLNITELQTIIPNIRIIRHSKNKGAPAARNRGLLEAKGSAVIFWDADVVGVPTMLQRMKRTLDAHLEVDVVYSNFVFGPKTFRGQPFSYEALTKRNYIHSTSLVRARAAMPWDETLKKLQDWDYWLTLAERGSSGYWIDEVLYTVGQRRSGMSKWIPSFAYRAPFRWLPYIRTQVHAYEAAEAIVRKKHGI
jgi:glycosyltransferase involved in cell wall biosynthesis